MGPFANPVVIQTRPRWLAVLVCAAASVLALARLGPSPGLDAGPPATSAPDPDDELARIARAQDAWMAVHGRGCARATDHLVPYAPGTSPTDRWGNPIELTCERDRSTDAIRVRVESRGPDGVAGTADDRWATWSDLGHRDGTRCGTTLARP